MTFLRNVTSILFVAASLCLSVSGNPKASDGDSRERKFMKVSELKPGMKGKSLTVFSGTEPEEFDVEIIGVVPGSLGPRQDMIIGRISGGSVDRTSVFAGMSGSPVYIDGKLVGAISFAFPFAKEPLCGITPIEQMLEIFGVDPSTKANATPVFSFEELMPTIGGRKSFPNGRNLITGTIDPKSSVGSVAGQYFKPIGVPVSFTGISRTTLGVFASDLSDLELVPVSYVSGTAQKTELAEVTEDTLIGGRSISVQLARGDVSVTASGTSTLRDGNRVYAFGHPFLSLGGVEMPMAESSVVTVIPNISNSFKIANPGRMVGTMLQDRATGIYGELGRAPRMIPVNLDIRTSRSDIKQIRFEVVSDEFLTPLVLNIGVLNSILANERQVGETTVKSTGVIRLKGQDPVKIDRDFTGPSASIFGTLSVTTPVTTLLRGRFDDLEIEGIDILISVSEGSRTGTIESIRTDKLQYKAGDTALLTVFIRAESGEVSSEQIKTTIPMDTPPGPLVISVSDAATALQNSALTQFTASNLKELISTINAARRDDRLYVQLMRSANSIVMGMSEMRDLPPSVTASINTGNNSNIGKAVPQSVIGELEIPRGKVFATGVQTIAVQIIR